MTNDAGSAPSRIRLWFRSAYAQMALAFLIGALGTIIFRRLGLPLPWFLGSMTAVLLAAVWGVPVQRAAFLSAPMRAILGVAVGVSFTPALLGRVGSMLASLALLVPLTFLIVFFGTKFFRRFAGFDHPTAFFAAVPGGVTDMVTLAGDAGADERAVTLVQVTRIIVVIFALPFFIQYVLGLEISRGQVSRVQLHQIALRDGLVDIALALGGWWIAHRFKVFGAPLIGPMLASGLAHAAGLTQAAVPLEVMNMAQLTLGVLLGCQFKGLTLREFNKIVLTAGVYAVMILAVSASAAYLAHWLIGVDMLAVLLAYAPGGQTELLLIALVLGLDAPFVALHHLLRLAAVIIGAQIVFKRNADWRRPEQPAE